MTLYLFLILSLDSVTLRGKLVLALPGHISLIFLVVGGGFDPN